MAHPRQPARVVVLFRGEPPALAPDPWDDARHPRIVALARAIAASGGWAERPPAALVVRGAPDPVIAAIGRFEPADEAWLSAARAQWETVVPRLRWLDHRAAEAAAETLASALTARFGVAELRRWRYAGVPRGGLFVLATLAYLLDLPAASLGTTADRVGVGDPATKRDAAGAQDATPLVLVDDVAISGLRLSQHVRRLTAPRIIVATLHAHPDLRQALVDAHRQVTEFVSAIDLEDHAPATLASEHEAWHARWRGRLDPNSLWIGQPDHVVYPWNEPDLSVWNPLRQREEHGWPLLPPARCLKRRSTPAIPVQHVEASASGDGPHPSVIAADLDDRIVLANVDTGAALELDEVGSTIWRELVAQGDPGAAAERVAAAYGADPRQVAADVTAFVADLTAAGWWREADAR